MFSVVELMFSNVEYKFNNVEFKFNDVEHKILLCKDTILSNRMQDFS